MVVPRLFFLPGSLRARDRMFFLERTFGPQALPVDPALFLSDRQFRGPATRPPQRGFQAHAFNAPTQNSDPLPDVSWARSGPFLAPQKPPEFWADKPVTRCLDRPAKWSLRNPLGSTGGTQTHSRRTGSKLGQLRYARQGLVRVPESNTKYGGKSGKTGVGPIPVIGPSISES